MDLRRATRSPVWTGSSIATESRSPSMSPAHRKHLNGGVGGGYSTVKRTQNVATKAAAQRLAKVMASQNTDNDEYDDDDDDDDDHEFKFAVPSSLTNSSTNLPTRRNYRSQSPALGRNPTVQVTSVRSSSAGRPSTFGRSVTPNASPSWMPPKASLKPPSVDRDNRYFHDVRLVNSRDRGHQRETSALRDELDMLQEENETVLEKLHIAEEKRQAAEARARELEKQVASLGDGVSLEAKLLSRKEAALRQREAALKEKKDGTVEEVASLRSELKMVKDEAATAVQRLQEAESEVKALRTTTQRMVLTQDEMEEVALKRCWLARYWGLAVQHGICADIAKSRHESWSALAPLPFELVMSAAQKAKELSPDQGGSDESKTNKFLSDLTGEGNIESMLSVEMGLRELASLKVEEAVMLAFAQKRTPSFVRQSTSMQADSNGHGELRFVETYELKEGELEDVAFKQAWLMYFWGRAKLHGVEEDIADERLQFWISRSGGKFPTTSHDAIDVERGLLELRKLGVEQQLWEACRKETDHKETEACRKETDHKETEACGKETDHKESDQPLPSSSPTSTLSNHNLDS